MKPFVRHLSVIFCLMFGSTILAEPVAYRLAPSDAKIAFSYTFGDRKITGQFPDLKTNLVIDFQNVGNSRVSVEANAKTVRGGFPFATGILRGPDMLNAQAFPTVRFVSQRVTGGGNTATIAGLMTIRGVTKPQTFKAQLFRAKGQSASDFSQLRMKLSGQLNRHDFGASAFPNEVGAILTISIDAKITAKPNAR